ncbi:MAG: PAS domain S-box protein [Chloroflexota bacterium]|nr:PAS domain S-box protein [Chloroflexota bacterium]
MRILKKILLLFLIAFAASGSAAVVIGYLHNNDITEIATEATEEIGELAGVEDEGALRSEIEAVSASAIEEIGQTSNTQLMMLAVVIGGITAFSTLAFLLIYRKIAKDIRLLDEGSQKINSGDLSHRIAVDSKGELMKLANTINQIAGESHKNKGKYENYRSKLRDILKESDSYEMGKELLQKEIKERTRIEKALRESEEQFRSISEESFDIIITTNENGMITYISPAVERTLLFKPEEIIGKNILDYLTKTSSLDISYIFSNTPKNKHIKTTEVEIRRKDGINIYAEITASKMLKDSSISGVQAIIRDITDRKKAEQEREELYEAIQMQSQETLSANRNLAEALKKVEQAQEELKNSQAQLMQSEKLAAVGQLISGVTHELNNPLMAISGYAQLMLEDVNDEILRENLQTLRKESKRAITIVRDLLSFARKQEPQRAYVSVNESLESTIRLREYEFNVENIEVIAQFAPNLSNTMADFHQLQQVFLNIIINAEQAMKAAHGKGTLSVKTEEIHGRIRITFTDDGPGMNQHVLNRIFEPFYTTKEIGEGTGLGLSLCHGIITEHEGELRVQSEVNKGTTFIVELPIISEEIACPV